MERDAELETRLRQRLAAWDIQAPASEGLRRAAVALVVTDEGLGADLHGLPAQPAWSRRAALVVTRRALTLRQHPGQFALPGGRIDEGETPEQTALRELAEEVNLVLDASAVLGRLDDFVTRSGYAITPVVMWAGAAETMQPNPGEVASIHRLPLTELLREDAPLLSSQAGSTQPVLRMPVGEGWIAAPTAALLYQFREVCLLDRPTRVAHFEQPHFAWY